MVQARQFRKFHPDSHYASALYRYFGCFARKHASFASFFSLDDKHYRKVGEPGHPVAAVERGKRVIVALDKKFIVSDHDFTRFSLIPTRPHTKIKDSKQAIFPATRPEHTTALHTHTIIHQRVIDYMPVSTTMFTMEVT